MKSPVGIFGGTFDPIHFGHLRIALELLERLHFTQVRFIPCKNPPHRGIPGADAFHRLNMLKLATKSVNEFMVDDIELRREGPSYMVDTLAALRLELPETPLCLMLGMDAFAGLASWHRFGDLITLAHMVVVDRPYCRFPGDAPLKALLEKHETEDTRLLSTSLAGAIVRMDRITQLSISATHVRTLIRTGRRAHFLLPDTVLDYIEQHQLYRGEHEKDARANHC